MTSRRSPFLRALEVDDSLPIEPEAMRQWLADLERPTRWCCARCCRGCWGRCCM